MTFERTRDLGFVRAILTDPRIWPHVGDDFSGPRDTFQPNSDPRIWWVRASNGDVHLGLFMFLPRSTVLWEEHVSMLPSAWGPKALKAGREVIPWLWEHTTCRRLIGEIPASNTLAIRYAEACGFERYGVNPRAFMKKGVLEDLVLLGISKEV